jgi:site-specific recombinase
MLGAFFLAVGVVCLLIRHFLVTSRREAVRQADEALADEGWRGMTVGGTFLFGAVMVLVIGVVLVTVSFITYAGF